MFYKTIDLNKLNRGKLFQFYIDKMRIVMGLTVDIDVTNLKTYSKKNDVVGYIKNNQFSR